MICLGPTQLSNDFQSQSCLSHLTHVTRLILNEHLLGILRFQFQACIASNYMIMYVNLFKFKLRYEIK